MKYFNGEDIDGDTAIMHSIISDLQLKSGTARKKLCPQGASVLYGQTFRGFLKYDKNGKKVLRKRVSKRLFETTLKTDYPELMNVFKEYRDLYFSDFDFNNVMINKNYPVKRHKDASNVGESVLLTFGDYTGGETKIEFGVDMFINTNCNPCKFDGSQYYHSVMPFEGERYALVFFKHNV